MKKLLFIPSLLFFGFYNVPNFRSCKMDEQNWKIRNELVLVFDAIIENDCICIRIYPRWRSITFNKLLKPKRKNFNLVGKAKESKTRTASLMIYLR
jgi:hypothetical protein